jgi:hypothetical protein
MAELRIIEFSHAVAFRRFNVTRIRSSQASAIDERLIPANDSKWRRALIASGELHNTGLGMANIQSSPMEIYFVE